jgi:hypothetical protein
MKSILLLSALAFGAVVTQQAVACDWNKEASNAPVVVAEGSCSNSAVEQPADEPIVQPQPQGGDCSSCATPAPVTPQRTEVPELKSLKVAGGNCSDC